jgi:tetratricopeptide (TPR) repeat protein
LAPNPEDAAALIACLSQTGDLAMSAGVGRQFPSHPLVLAQLALALAQEKPRQAQAAAQTALEGLLNNKDGSAKGTAPSTLLHQHLLPLLHALMARLYWNFGHRLGDRRLAAQSIQAALHIWPDEPRWHALAANIFLALDQDGVEDCAPKAIEHLEQALRLDPHQAEFTRQLGQLLLKRGRPSEAVPLLERACQLTPEDAQSWMSLASAHQARGENEQASLRAERASLLAPDWIEPLLLRSELALATRKLPEAQQHAQAVLSIDPLQPKALMIITRALQAAGKSVEALEALEKALEQTGSVPLALKLEKVRLVHDAHGAKASLQFLEELKQEYPQDASLLALQSEYLEEAGEDESAARTAQEALRAMSLDDSADSEQLFRLHYLVGRLLGKAGQLDQAIHHLSEAIRQRPENVEPYLELGRVHLERRQYSQAQRLFQQAIQAAPHDPRGYYHAGMAMKEGRDYLEAERLLRKASDLAPKDLNIRRLLGAVVALNLVHNRRAVGRDLPTRGG